jgi:hypothetical protein
MQACKYLNLDPFQRSISSLCNTRLYNRSSKDARNYSCSDSAVRYEAWSRVANCILKWDCTWGAWRCKVLCTLSPQHGASSGCGWRNGLQLWRLAANILNEQPWTNDKGWSSSLGVGRGGNNHSQKKINVVWKFKKSLGPGWILWINDPRYGIWIWDLVPGMLEVCIGRAPWWQFRGK